MAVEMVQEGLISKEEALLRVDARSVDFFLHPTIDPKAKKNVVAKGYVLYPPTHPPVNENGEMLNESCTHPFPSEPPASPLSIYPTHPPTHLPKHSLPASPGVGTGTLVFTSDEAEAMAKDGKQVLLIRKETTAEDVHGMKSAKGVLTQHGGMTR